MVSIKGLDKADVLIALYRSARAQGMGLMFATSEPMSRKDALALLASQTYFDYVRGRVMKVDLRNDDEFDPRLFDRDNGSGAAQRAIDSLVARGA